MSCTNALIETSRLLESYFQSIHFHPLHSHIIPQTERLTNLMNMYKHMISKNMCGFILQNSDTLVDDDMKKQKTIHYLEEHVLIGCDDFELIQMTLDKMDENKKADIVESANPDKEHYTYFGSIVVDSEFRYAILNTQLCLNDIKRLNQFQHCSYIYISKEWNMIQSYQNAILSELSTMLSKVSNFNIVFAFNNKSEFKQYEFIERYLQEKQFKRTQKELVYVREVNDCFIRDYIEKHFLVELQSLEVWKVKRYEMQEIQTQRESNSNSVLFAREIPHYISSVNVYKDRGIWNNFFKQPMIVYSKQ